MANPKVGESVSIVGINFESGLIQYRVEGIDFIFNLMVDPDQMKPEQVQESVKQDAATTVGNFNFKLIDNTLNQKFEIKLDEPLVGRNVEFHIEQPATTTKPEDEIQLALEF